MQFKILLWSARIKLLSAAGFGKLGLVKFRDFYSSHLLVAGFLMLILGIGNWIVGAVQIAKYQGLLQKTSQTGLEDSYRSFQELDRQKNEEVLRRITEDREKYNPAQVKLDFYYVVVGGGRLFFFLGAFLTFFALMRALRKDTLVKMRKLSSQP